MDPSPGYSALQAIGFATGAALCCMLGALQLRIDRVERISSPYPWLWAVCLLWNVGCFLQYMLILAGRSPTSTAVGVAALLAWSAITGATSYILSIVQRSLNISRVLGRVLLFVSTIASATIIAFFAAAVFLEQPTLSFPSVMRLSFANAVANWALCGLLYLTHRQPRHAEAETARPRIGMNRVRVVLILALPISSFALFSDAQGMLSAIAQTVAQQWAIPFVVVTASFYANRVYADVVLKRTLRLLGCVCISALLMRFIFGGDDGLSIVVATMVGSALLFGAPWLTHALDGFVDTVLLKRPDYAAIAAQFAERVHHTASAQEVTALMQATIRDALKHRTPVAPALTADIPLATSTPAPNSVSQLFMQGELAFLRAIASDGNRRLEVLANETERREARLREERLSRAATESELAALRAQINPHFLFNTLNSIAELISSAPQIAEGMTERLAEFFRYTLSRSQKTLSTVRDELEFTRHYLEIESIRFGKRLQVHIDGDEKLNDMKVPSLILQPLVENAVRHGIAPKRGGGTVSVSAKLEGRLIQLRVLDDGVGMQAGNSIASSGSGIGLQNVRERLRALHGDRAVVTIAAGLNGCGTLVTLLLPIDGD